MTVKHTLAIYEQISRLDDDAIICKNAFCLLGLKGRNGLDNYVTDLRL